MNVSLAPPASKRNTRFDNLKALLIFLVVFGHMLEPLEGSVVNTLYLIIYSFHMPAFIFVSGWFSQNSTVKRTLIHILPPYLLFQLLYILYRGDTIQFHSPVWILWYLFALMAWRLILPVLRLWRPLPWLMIPVSITLSLICGYCPWIGYDLALSRILVFWPYFLLGYCLSRLGPHLEQICQKPISRGLSLLGALGCSGFFYHVRYLFLRHWTFGAADYGFSGSSPKIRLILLAAALLWIWFLMSWMPSSSFPILSTIGQNTLYIYLLHGFLKLSIDAHADWIYQFSGLGNLLLATGLALSLTVLFGNSLISKLWQSIKSLMRTGNQPPPGFSF